MKLLFLCNQGKNRSRAASELWLKMNPNDEVVARGLYRDDKSELKTLLAWANKIIVFEDRHISEVRKLDGSLSTYVKIVNFSVPDMYDYGTDKLVSILSNKFKDKARLLK